MTLFVSILVTFIFWVLFLDIRLGINEFEKALSSLLMMFIMSILTVFLITPGEKFFTLSLWMLIYGLFLDALGEFTVYNFFVELAKYTFIVSGSLFFTISILELIKANKQYTLLSNMLDRINDAVFVWDKNGKLLLMNESAHRLVGYSFDELKGKGADTIVSEDEKEYTKRTLEFIQSHSPDFIPMYEKKLVDKEGKLIFVEESVSTIKDEKGNVLYIIETARDISDRKKLEELLTKEREKFYKYFDLAQVIMVILNREGKIELINQKGCEVLGYSKRELIGKDWFDFIPEHQEDEMKKVFESIINGQIEPFEKFENFILNSRGEYRLISWRNTYIKDDNNEIVFVLSSGMDITESRKKHIYTQRMKEVYELLFDITTLVLNVGWNEEYYQTLLERLLKIVPEAQAGSCLIRKNGDFKFVAAVGYDLKKLENFSIPEKIVKIYSEEVEVIRGKMLYELDRKENMEKLSKLLRKMSGRTLKAVLVIPLYLGNYLMGAIYLDNFESESAFVQSIEIASIVSNYLQMILWKQRTDERLRHLATHDMLTNTLNRAAFMEMAEKIMKLSKRNDRKFAIIYIDLDDFKEVNDSYGHEFGDEFLSGFCRKIQSFIRESDLFARFGGDEFVLLLPETDEKGARLFLERFRKTLTREFELKGEKIEYRFSAGIAIFPDDGEDDLEKLINIADKRMYEDKRERKLRRRKP